MDGYFQSPPSAATAPEAAKPRLDAEDADERDCARREMIESRRAAIRTQVKLADREPSNLVEEYVKYDAVRLLGEYRAADGARVLIKNLDYSPKRTLVLREEEGPLTRYPAAEALARIGSPTIDYVLACWTSGDISDQQRRLLAFLVYRLDGRELGRARLEIARSQAEGSRKRHLSRLIDLYDRTDFQDVRQWPRPSQ